MAADDARLLGIKERAAAVLMALPGVTGVGIGGRLRDGRPTAGGPDPAAAGTDHQRDRHVPEPVRRAGDDRRRVRHAAQRLGRADRVAARGFH